jgi:hypothetical protein
MKLVKKVPSVAQKLNKNNDYYKFRPVDAAQENIIPPN